MFDGWLALIFVTTPYKNFRDWSNLERVHNSSQKIKKSKEKNKQPKQNNGKQNTTNSQIQSHPTWTINSTSLLLTPYERTVLQCHNQWVNCTVSYSMFPNSLIFRICIDIIAPRNGSKAPKRNSQTDCSQGLPRHKEILPWVASMLIFHALHEPVCVCCDIWYHN